MEYKTFGDKNNKTVMLLHGNLMTWRQFADVIPLLENDFRVIAVSFDGFDGTGKIDYPGAEREAELLSEYIKKECGSKLDCLFAESLGCCPALYMKSDSSIDIKHMILSGTECLDCGIFNGLIIKLIPNKQKKMIDNFKNPDYKFPWYLMKITGQTQDGMRKLIQAAADNISEESLRQTCKTGINIFRTVDSLPVQPDADVFCWYGERESGMKKALKKLNRLYPKLHKCCLEGYGHGEIIRHPKRLADGIKKILT